MPLLTLHVTKFHQMIGSKYLPKGTPFKANLDGEELLFSVDEDVEGIEAARKKAISELERRGVEFNKRDI